MGNNGTQEAIEPGKPRKENWRIGTFDIETFSETIENQLLAPFCLGATCISDSERGVVYHDTPVALLEYMLAFGDTVKWYAHNGARFDFFHIFEDAECQQLIESRGYKVDVIGGDKPKALMFKRGKKTTFFCDSYKLMPVPLGKLTKDFKVRSTKGFINFEAGEKFYKNNPAHREYLRDDVLGLYQVMVKYRRVINEEFGGIEPRTTAPSTAFKSWCALLDERVYKHSPDVNAFARLSYYGGRTECYHQGEIFPIVCIDVNSLYPYIMQEVGGLHKPFYTTRWQEEEYEGFYKVRASIPETSKFGYLPYRKPDKTGVLFPVGRFTTYATSSEIRFAMESGCDIQVIEGWCFEINDKQLFTKFVDKCKNLRAKDYNGSYGQTAKIMQNSLYGIFGMNPNKKSVLYSPYLPDEEGYEQVLHPETAMPVPNLWCKSICEETLNCIPAWAAWTTGNARLHILKAAIKEENAGNYVAYKDTDSLFIRVANGGSLASYINEGEYGAFKIEYPRPGEEQRSFVGITAKSYMTVQEKLHEIGYSSSLEPEELSKMRGRGSYIDEFGSQFDMKIKGLPKRSLTPEMFWDGGKGIATEVEFAQINSLLMGLRTGQIGKMSKRSSPTVRSITTRVPAIDGNGPTMPIVLHEF